MEEQVEEDMEEQVEEDMEEQAEEDMEEQAEEESIKVHLSRKDELCGLKWIVSINLIATRLKWQSSLVKYTTRA